MIREIQRAATPACPPPLSDDQRAQLFYLYFETSDTQHQIMQALDITGPQLIAWRSDPQTQRTIDAHRDFAQKRADDIAALARPSAVKVLHELVTDPNTPAEARRKAATQIIRLTNPPPAKPPASHPEPEASPRPPSPPRSCPHRRSAQVAKTPSATRPRPFQRLRPVFSRRTRQQPLRRWSAGRRSPQVGRTGNVRPRGLDSASDSPRNWP